MTIRNGQSGGRPARRFISLRTKLIGFVSLIIVVICSALGVYFIQQRAEVMDSSLNALILKTALITVVIILCGIAVTIVLARRIITPLKCLAGGASRVAEGDLTVSVTPTTHDEVGQLTEVFTHMTESLKERDLAISTHIQTITKQVRELAALNKISMAIATTLDLDKLLATMLRLLIENVGFAKARLVLYDSDRRVAYGSRLAGVPEAVDGEGRPAVHAGGPKSVGHHRWRSRGGARQRQGLSATRTPRAIVGAAGPAPDAASPGSQPEAPGAGQAQVGFRLDRVARTADTDDFDQGLRG